MTSGRWWWAVLAAGGAALLAVQLPNPILFTADDSAFYLVIGRHLVDGDGATFNGVLPTNGFQPLWQVVVAALVGVAELVGITSPIGQLRLVVVGGWAVLVAGLVLLERLLRGLGAGVGGCVAAVALSLAFLGGPANTVGSEANLVFLLAVCLLARATRALSTGTHWRDEIVLAGLAGLLVLARLDMFCLAVPVLVAVVLHRPREIGAVVRRCANIGVAAAIVLVPYLSWNLARFGELMPIAGRIKLDTGGLQLHPVSLGLAGWGLLGLGTVLGVIAFVRRPAGSALRLWALVAAAALANAGVYLSWSTGELTDLHWYRVPQLLGVTVAVAFAWERLAPSSDRPRWILASALLGLVALATWVTAGLLFGPSADDTRAVLAFGASIDEALPDRAIVAVFDIPGRLALSSDRPIVALDGLTGDFDFQDDLRDRGVVCALTELGVTEVVAPRDDAEGEGPRQHHIVHSWLHRVDVGTLDFAPEDLVVDEPDVGLTLWRFDQPCAEESAEA